MRKHNRRQFVKLVAATSAVAMTELARAVESTDQPGKTILGIFNVDSAELVKSIGAKAVRIFISEDAIGDAQTYKRLTAFKEAGIAVVTTLGFGANDKKGEKLPVIGSDEWNRKIGLIETLFKAGGPSIAFCTLDNEPAADMFSQFVPDAEGRIPAIEWFRALAERGKKAIQSDPQCAHIKMSSPALFRMAATPKNAKETDYAARNAMLLQWANADRNIDVLDVHAHVSSVEEMEDTLVAMGRKTPKPLIITEWSQARGVWSWLDEPADISLVKLQSLPPAATNKQFVHACYTKPVTKEEWDEFVARAPYDATFMEKAYAEMVKHNVLVATYGAYRQYGNVLFDTKQLYATMTVVPNADGTFQENYKFPAWYRALAFGKPVAREP